MDRDSEIQRQIARLTKRLGRVEPKGSGLYLTNDTPGAPAFVPTYFGATTAGVTTYTTQEGIYTRWGRVVSVQAKLVWTAATGTGVIRLGGLPYTALYDVAFAVRVVNVTFANSAPQGILQAGNAVAQLFSPLTNAAGTELVIEAAGSIWYQITYIVT